jgi:hypothetical protein
VAVAAAAALAAAGAGAAPEEQRTPVPDARRARLLRRRHRRKLSVRPGSLVEVCVGRARVTRVRLGGRYDLQYEAGDESWAGDAAAQGTGGCPKGRKGGGSGSVDPALGLAPAPDATAARDHDVDADAKAGAGRGSGGEAKRADAEAAAAGPGGREADSKQAEGKEGEGKEGEGKQGEGKESEGKETDHADSLRDRDGRAGSATARAQAAAAETQRVQRTRGRAERAVARAEAQRLRAERHRAKEARATDRRSREQGIPRWLLRPLTPHQLEQGQGQAIGWHAGPRTTKRSSPCPSPNRSMPRLRPGDDVEARFEARLAWYAARVTRAAVGADYAQRWRAAHCGAGAGDTFDVSYADGDTEGAVGWRLVRAAGSGGGGGEQGTQQQDAQDAAAGAGAGAGAGEHALAVGAAVEARFEGRLPWFAATVSRARGKEGTYDVEYADGDKEKHVARALLRAVAPSQPAVQGHTESSAAAAGVVPTHLAVPSASAGADSPAPEGVAREPVAGAVSESGAAGGAQRTGGVAPSASGSGAEWAAEPEAEKGQGQVAGPRGSHTSAVASVRVAESAERVRVATGNPDDAKLKPEPAVVVEAEGCIEDAELEPPAAER